MLWIFNVLSTEDNDLLNVATDDVTNMYEAWDAAYNCMEMYGLHRWRTETRNIFDSLFSIWWKDRTQIRCAEPLIFQIFIGDDKVFVSFDKDFPCYFKGVAVCWCSNCWPGWCNHRRCRRMRLRLLFFTIVAEGRNWNVRSASRANMLHVISAK